VLGGAVSVIFEVIYYSKYVIYGVIFTGVRIYFYITC